MQRQHKPDFLGIGLHKGGTTWLFQQLKQHQDIWLPPMKELHYFDRDKAYASPNFLAESSPLKRSLSDVEGKMRVAYEHLQRNRERGNLQAARWWYKFLVGRCSDNWYRSLFAEAGSKVCGEITPAYSILNKQSLLEIKQLNPDIKIILMLRNPVERAWSAVKFNFLNLKVGGDISSVSDIRQCLDDPGMVARGNVSDIIERYQSVFKGNFLVCFYDAIKQNPNVLLSEICGFLGVEPDRFKENIASKRVNASPQAPMPAEVKTYLTDCYVDMLAELDKTYAGYFHHWYCKVTGQPASPAGPVQASLRL